MCDAISDLVRDLAVVKWIDIQALMSSDCSGQVPRSSPHCNWRSNQKMVMAKATGIDAEELCVVSQLCSALHAEIERAVHAISANYMKNIVAMVGEYSLWMTKMPFIL